jgi:serine/threonine-protein kinase HipA
MLAALFSSSRGIVFSSMISNTDDHLRNHGFLCRSRLVAAVPGLRPQSCAHRYQIAHSDQDEARKIAAEVGHAVATWRREAKKLGLTAAEIDRMASSFEHQDLKEALASAAHHLP